MCLLHLLSRVYVLMCEYVWSLWHDKCHRDLTNQYVVFYVKYCCLACALHKKWVVFICFITIKIGSVFTQNIFFFRMRAANVIYVFYHLNFTSIFCFYLNNILQMDKIPLFVCAGNVALLLRFVLVNTNLSNGIFSNCFHTLF